MRVAFTAYCVSLFLSDAKLVCCGIGVDCSHVVQFTAHFAYLDLLNHFKILAPRRARLVGLLYFMPIAVMDNGENIIVLIGIVSRPIPTFRVIWISCHCILTITGNMFQFR